MKKIILRENEQIKYDLIKKLNDSNGNKERAAIKLNCSLRNINRLLKGYREFGKEFFIHGNRERKPSTTLQVEIQEKIVSLFKDKYFDFNFKHFFEKLTTVEGIKCSYPTVVSLLYSRGFVSPKAHKKTKKRIKEALKKIEKIESVSIVKEEESRIVPLKEAHPRMPRSKYFGELIQMDASLELWFGDAKTQLHIAIDDATGKIVGGYFDKQETLFGYYQITSQILNNYGIPAKFLTDRRTVFDYKKSGDTSLENDYTTQFGYACSQLGIALESSSVPQAKGRVERVFGTLQSRLKAELRILGINDIESANKYLMGYIELFNEQFSINDKSIKSVFETVSEPEKIDLYLSVGSERIIDNGHCFKYKNQYYSLLDKKGEVCYLKPKTKVLVLNSLSGILYCVFNGETYTLQVVEKHEKTSVEFDLEEKEKKPKQKYRPPSTHPWKAASFQKYLERNSEHRIDPD